MGEALFHLLVLNCRKNGQGGAVLQTHVNIEFFKQTLFQPLRIGDGFLCRPFQSGVNAGSESVLCKFFRFKIFIAHVHEGLKEEAERACQICLECRDGHCGNRIFRGERIIRLKNEMSVRVRIGRRFNHAHRLIEQRRTAENGFPGALKEKS